MIFDNTEISTFRALGVGFGKAYALGEAPDGSSVLLQTTIGEDVFVSNLSDDIEYA
jgi:hypothetical protein